MNKIQFLILLAGLAGGPIRAAEPPGPAVGGSETNAPGATNASSAAVAAPLPAAPPESTLPVVSPVPDNGTNALGGTAPAEAGTNGLLRLNFRGASLDMVLNYLSEAAGFIIVLEAQPRGKVDVWSNTPVTREEAVNLLNSVLNKNGYAAIRRDRTLTIVNKDEAKTKAIPVKLGAEPDAIPDNDEMVTQVIPVRFVEVAQLIKDLQPLVSTQTPMTANESGNSVVITDTQANIRRVAEIIKAIDAGAEDVTVVRVFRLTYADPNEMSDLLVSLFPDDSRSSSSSPVQFGGFRRFFGGGPPGFGGNTSSSSGTQNQRIKKRARVIAVPDARTASVVVSAAKDLMDQIEGVVTELDNNPARKQTVKVFQLENADPQQAMQVLQDIFQKSGTVNNRNAANQNSALQTRSTTQSQQYNNSSSSRMGTSRGVSGRGLGQ